MMPSPARYRRVVTALVPRLGCGCRSDALGDCFGLLVVKYEAMRAQGKHSAYSA